jgi:SAM-dependent methyltransferase
MYEASKALMRRLHDSRFATRYFVGDGIDVGAGPDSLAQYAEQFPLMRSCRPWDLDDGDAQFLAGVPDESLDFIHSSHCLEHLHDPHEALHHWLRVLKPGGHLVVVIPDEDLFEQGVFPSTNNPDHKWTFTMHKVKSWSDKSINIVGMLAALADRAQIIKVEQLDATYRFNLERRDQTMTPVGECAVEFVLRKITADEHARRGRLPTAARAAMEAATPQPLEPVDARMMDLEVAPDPRDHRWKFLTAAVALPAAYHLYQYVTAGAGRESLPIAGIAGQLAGGLAAGYVAWWLWATVKRILFAYDMQR